MINEKVQKALNEQVKAEMWSANLYLSMSFYMAVEGYDGLAHWLKKQSQEEMEHAYDMADYVIKRGGVAKVERLDEVPQNWKNPEEVFQHVYNHECHVSKLINDIMDLAVEQRDNATQDFMWKYIREQVEEEATALNIYEKVKKAGEAGLLYLDSKLGQRK